MHGDTILGLDVVQLAHASRERGAGRFDQQMIVVVHQTVGVAQPTMQADHPRQGGEKLPTVSVIVDDALAGKAETLCEQNVRLQDLTLFTRPDPIHAHGASGSPKWCMTLRGALLVAEYPFPEGAQDVERRLQGSLDESCGLARTVPGRIITERFPNSLDRKVQILCPRFL